MKKSLSHLMFGSLFAALLAVGQIAHAQPTPAATTETAKPKRTTYPFFGTVASVDASAKTISLKKKEGERVLHTDAKTTLEMDGKPATLADIKAGNYLHGTLHKDAAKEEFILKAKIDLEAPAKKGTNAVVKATTPVVAPVVAAAATTEDTATNAVVKAKKKKKKAASSATNAPAVTQ